MLPTNQPNRPLQQAGYMPYFYASGRFLNYGQPRPQKPRGFQTYPISAPEMYDFSSDRPTFGSRDGTQTVEQIIANGYFAVPGSDPETPETAILSDKQHTASLGLTDVISQVRQRYAIFDRNTYELEQAVCEANNAVHRQEADQGSPANESQRESANKMAQSIYEQQRSERVSLWRDVARVRSTLPELAQQYLSIYRKLSFLDDMDGDGP